MIPVILRSGPVHIRNTTNKQTHLKIIQKVKKTSLLAHIAALVKIEKEYTYSVFQSR
jgi:hypothetical protein